MSSSSTSAPNTRPQQHTHQHHQASASTTHGAPTTAPERSYFETQRAALIGEIAISMEHVLANINKLNRSLEGVIAVGNEFGSVEALWSQFEGVMGREQEGGRGGDEERRDREGGGERDRDGERDEEDEEEGKER